MDRDINNAAMVHWLHRDILKICISTFQCVPVMDNVLSTSQKHENIMLQIFPVISKYTKKEQNKDCLGERHKYNQLNLASWQRPDFCQELIILFRLDTYNA